MIFVVLFTWWNSEVYKLKILPTFMTPTLWWKCLLYRNKFNKLTKKLVNKSKTEFKALWKLYKPNLIISSGLKIWPCALSLYISINTCIELYKMLTKNLMHIKPHSIEYFCNKNRKISIIIELKLSNFVCFIFNFFYILKKFLFIRK